MGNNSDINTSRHHHQLQHQQHLRQQQQQQLSVSSADATSISGSSLEDQLEEEEKFIIDHYDTMNAVSGVLYQSTALHHHNNNNHNHHQQHLAHQQPHQLQPAIGSVGGSSVSTSSSLSPNDSDASASAASGTKYHLGARQASSAAAELQHAPTQALHSHPNRNQLTSGISYHQSSGAAEGSYASGNQQQYDQQHLQTPPGHLQRHQHHLQPHQHHHQQQHQQSAPAPPHHQHQHQQHQQHQHHHFNVNSHAIDSTTLSSTHHNHQSKKSPDKGSDEYKKRRERNNVAVRKSREKAKMRSRETERRVAELSKENQLYRAQYEELRREFNVLKSLLLKTGLTEQVIEDEAQRHSSAIQHQISQQVSAAVAVNGAAHHQQTLVAGNHHLVSSLASNSTVATLKGIGCVSSSAAPSTTHYNHTSSTLEGVEQWTEGINAYVEDWAS